MHVAAAGHINAGVSMKSLLLAVLALSVGACTSITPTEPGTPKTTAAKKPFHCERKGGPSVPPGPPERGYPECRDIPIAVVEFGNRCLTLIPYSELHVLARQGVTFVSWKLHAPEGYKFADVYIRPESLKKRPRDEVWELPNVSKDGRTFTWKLKEKAPPSSFEHEIFVTKDGRTCDQIDPVIHND
jgi:hypothetical protein